ncbi:hypothetical protein K1T71_008777 [Dendrolimus kikuchii]|uniref:Uncharacterized protein n=1 Tax=Dendrolimus kikuchii TaxID=765133 RepID=A0ACC1CWC1_9NEOP|nr:hypothetical protein K1T71_008777 [Dendrolimus kikuchii]
MQNSKAAATPILKDSELREDAGGNISFPYREAVGALAYLMVDTRPDIAYALSVVSRHLEAPTKRDVLKVKRIFRYLNGTRNYCITYKRGMQTKLVCYSDADHGVDPDTGRSSSGFVCVYGGPISWRSKLQTSVAI